MGLGCKEINSREALYILGSQRCNEENILWSLGTSDFKRLFMAAMTELVIIDGPPEKVKITSCPGPVDTIRKR